MHSYAQKKEKMKGDKNEKTFIDSISEHDISIVYCNARIVNHATHGVVMHFNKCNDGGIGISSDLPGAVSTYLEDNFEGSVALWISGAAGDQNPLVMNEMYTPSTTDGTMETSRIPGGCIEILEYLAKIQYQDTLKALNSIEEFSSDVKISYDYEESTIPSTTGGDYQINLQLWRIGDIAFAGHSGELFSAIGVYLKENSLLEDTIICNLTWIYSEQSTGYHADDVSRVLGGFETNPSYASGYISEGLTELLNNMIENTNS